ncbi:MAG: sodium:solute symporter family protein [Gemmatimonadota bacterium]|nr:sodium:solute symporter family protein [Gemmatimonadota bacterium]
MDKSTVITFIIFAYLAVTLGVGIVAGRRASRSVQGFVAGDRDFGLLVMYFITGATVFSAFAFLGGPGWAYSRGAAAFYILTYGVLGMAPWYAMGPKAAALGRRFGFVTQAQLLVGRFPSRALSAVMALLTLAAFVPYVTIQMRGAGIVIEAVTDGAVPLAAGAALAYGIVLLYVLTSGVSAVGWTNTFQGVFMVGIAWALGIYLPNRLYGGVGPMFEQILANRPELLSLPGLDGSGEPWSWGAYSTAILASAIGLTMWPHLFMKAFTARSDATIRRTVILFPTFQLFLIPVFLIGFAGVMFPESPEQSDFILPFLILRSDLPALVVGLFCAGALSASMSTGDALLHGAASVAVQDGVQPFRSLTDRGQRLLMRMLVVAVGAVAYLFALVERFSLVDLLLASYGIIAQFMPSLLSAMYWKRATTTGVVWGLVAGSAVSVFFFRFPELKPFGMHEGILGLVVHVPVLLIVSLLGKAQDPEHVNRYVNV